MIDEDSNGSDIQPIRPRKLFWDIFGVVVVIIVACAALMYYYTLVPPYRFDTDQALLVDQGMSVRDITRRAANQQLVRSDIVLYVILTGLYDPTTIHAGRYIFTEPMSAFGVAKKIASQEVDDPLITLTIPEGIRAEQIAAIAASVLPEFDTADYMAGVKSSEGYLFPDTYYVPESFTAEQFLLLQSKTFTEKVAPLEAQASSTWELDYDPIILASIIEREANDEESMRTVAGILLNRLEAGMPLQADATIEYVLDTPLNELAPGELAKHLDEVDSPYNTYKNRGLPPTAIGNPGLMAIKAALFPKRSDYFYYITDNEGNFHYATTLEEHNTNVARYLR